MTNLMSLLSKRCFNANIALSLVDSHFVLTVQYRQATEEPREWVARRRRQPSRGAGEDVHIHMLVYTYVHCILFTFGTLIRMHA